MDTTHSKNGMPGALLPGELRCLTGTGTDTYCKRPRRLLLARRSVRSVCRASGRGGAAAHQARRPSSYTASVASCSTFCFTQTCTKTSVAFALAGTA